MRRGERGKPRERLLLADPSNNIPKKSLKTAGKRPRRVRNDTVQRFVEAFVSQYEVCIKDGDQSGFYKHLKGTDV